jgi:GxxExxY protein
MLQMKRHQDLSDDLNNISGQIVECVFQVHKTLGPGFLEINYEDALIYELSKKNLGYQRQVNFKIPYKDTVLNSQYRFDLIVENSVLLELKSVEKIHPIHKAQTIAYLKATGLPIGLLINFNANLIKDGIHRLTLRASDSPCTK